MTSPEEASTPSVRGPRLRGDRILAMLEIGALAVFIVVVSVLNAPGIVGWLWVEKKPKPEKVVPDPNKPIDWQSILYYYGERRLGRDLRRTKDRRRRVAALRRR